MATNELTIYAGDDLSLNLAIVNSSNVPVNITSYAIAFQVKINPQDASPLISYSLGSGISFINAVLGTAKVAVSHTDTKLTPGKYVYQVDTTDGTGFRTTIIQDNFTILPSVI